MIPFPTPPEKLLGDVMRAARTRSQWERVTVWVLDYLRRTREGDPCPWCELPEAGDPAPPCEIRRR
jgi:hypothetical protein